MDNKEKILQEKAFNQWCEGHTGVDSTSPEEKNYFQVFDALGEKPEINIPVDFARNVTTKAIKRMKVLSFIRSTFLIFLISLSLIAGTALVLSYISSDLVTNVWTALAPYKFPILFGIVVYLAIQAVDKIFIPRKADYSF